jgi:glutamate N-acetyltransferase/amino-acid N-acetyltransferase
MTEIQCSGFLAGGISAGLKKNREKDVGVIISEVTAHVAGVFTRNRVKAAPVVLDLERIKSGKSRAIIVNSGNANCCTGEKGLQDARTMADILAGHLNIDPEQVLVASTGVIGQPLPIEKIEAVIPELADNAGEGGIEDFAAAIMTTDTVPKIAIKKVNRAGKTYSVLGVAKGAGMIKPDMATLLSFICTDADVTPELLNQMLVRATRRTMNRITIDGDTSTNDTVLLMANGKSGVAIANKEDVRVFQKTLDGVMMELARMLVKDGEGATKLVEIIVRGALTDGDADQIAATIAHSNLVKTALFGEDANWGRIMAAAGRAGIEMDPEKVDIRFNDVLMVEKGCGCGASAEEAATEVLKKSEFNIQVDLNLGDGGASYFTCDFSVDYVRINADYRS